MTAHLLILLGALLIAAGCAHPIDAAIVSSNVAAATLTRTHATLRAARHDAQIAAAKRVPGDRTSAAVQAEKIDRMLSVVADYAPAWQAYSDARRLWLATIVAIQAAQVVSEQGGEPELAEVERLVIALARLVQELGVVAQEVSRGR